MAISYVLCSGGKLCYCGRCPTSCITRLMTSAIGVCACAQAQIDEDITCPVCCTDTETGAGARGRYARKRAAVLPSAYCSAGCACIPIPRNRIQTSIQACFLATQGDATPRCAADKHWPTALSNFQLARPLYIAARVYALRIYQSSSITPFQKWQVAMVHIERTKIGNGKRRWSETNLPISFVVVRVAQQTGSPEQQITTSSQPPAAWGASRESRSGSGLGLGFTRPISSCLMIAADMITTRRIRLDCFDAEKGK